MTDLAQRYGTRRRPARRLLVVAMVTLLAVPALTWLGWVALRQSRPLTQSELISFQVNGPHAATATLTVVRRTRDVAASCLLRAEAADHTIVGELDFTVDSSSPTTITLTKSVRTEREATSVALLGCSAPGQPSRR